MRTQALLAFLSMTLAAGAAPARGADTDSLELGGIVEAPGDPAAFGCEATALTYGQATEEYFSHYRAATRDEAELDAARDCAGRATELLFAPPAGGAYLARLRRLDARAESDPEAVADLAYQFQAEWEKRYLLEYIEQASIRGLQQATGSQMGYVAGMLYLVFGARNALHSPAQAVGYLTEMRLLITPVAIAAAGRAAGALSAQALHYVPIAPAAVVSLGIPVDSDPLDRAARYRALEDQESKLIAGVAGWATYAALGLRGVSQVSRFGRVGNFLAGVAVSVLAEEGARAVINHAEVASLRRDLVRAARDFEATARSGSRTQVLQSAAALLRAALMLEAHEKYSFLSAYPAHQRREQALARQYAADPARQAREIQALNRAFQDAAFAPLPASARYMHPEALEAMVIASLREMPLDPVDPAQRDAVLASVSETYRGPVRALIARFQASAAPVGAGAAARIAAFGEFLAARDRQRDGKLADRLLAGHVSAGIDVMFLQVGALLRNSGDEYLAFYADDIAMGKVRSQALLASEVRSWVNRRLAESARKWER
jgi:hypothetical protein